MQEYALALRSSRRTYRIAVGIMFFLQGLCFATWASRIPSIQQQLGLTNGALGIVLLSIPVGLLFSIPFSGWAIAKFGSRKIILLALLSYSFVLISIGTATSQIQLMFFLFLFGFMGNMSNISINTQAVGVEAVYQRSIMAAFHGMWSLAGFTAAGIGSVMIGNNISPLSHFLIIMSVIIISVLSAFRFTLKEDINKKTTTSKFTWPDKSLIKLGLIAFCSLICEGAMFDWSGVYFKEVVKAKQSFIGAGYTAFMCSMATGRFIADWFTTRFGMVRILRISGLLTAIGLAIAAIFPYVLTSIIGFLLVGFGVSSVVPLIYGAAGKSTKMSAGAAIAAVTTIGFFGFLIGPVLIGLVAEATSLRISFSLIAIMGICVALLSGKLQTFISSPA